MLENTVDKYAINVSSRWVPLCFCNCTLSSFCNITPNCHRCDDAPAIFHYFRIYITYAWSFSRPIKSTLCVQQWTLPIIVAKLKINIRVNWMTLQRRLSKCPCCWTLFSNDKLLCKLKVFWQKNKVSGRGQSSPSSPTHFIYITFTDTLLIRVERKHKEQ